MAKSADRTVEGFSKRFNYILDRAGFPPIGAGRAKALADRFGSSKSGAQNWIGKDLPPKRDTLRVIVSELLAEIQGNYNVNKAVAWMEHGAAVDNPFACSASSSLINIPMDSKHVLLSRVYISVHKIAKEKGIDIYSMEDDVIDHVYTSIIQQTLQSGNNAPDLHLISSLLELATRTPIQKPTSVVS